MVRRARAFAPTLSLSRWAEKGIGALPNSSGSPLPCEAGEG
ncbi:hypothetical protein [Azospirillum doebereinerae]